jgi:hypothetical protein
LEIKEFRGRWVREGREAHKALPATKDSRGRWALLEKKAREAHRVSWETKDHKAHKDLQEKKA